MQDRICAQRIAVLLPSLAGGGAERSMLHLVREFLRRGRSVELLLFRPQGPYLPEVPDGVRVVELKPRSGVAGRVLAALADPAGIPSLLRPVLLPFKADPDLRHIASLRRYLMQNPPHIVLSALTYANLTALWAKRLARTATPVVVSERNTLSADIKNRGRGWRRRYRLSAVSHTYRHADGIITVSNAVADDLVENARIDPAKVKTIYNPVVDSALLEKARQPLEHRWFGPDCPPVILGAGRLVPQKDFQTLLRAFAIVRGQRQARLVILGEGRQRPELESMARQLGIAADVELPGFVDNPYRYMARAAVFVLSSLYEGLPGVLIQALACGCPAASTDCPGGACEILGGGQYGRLAPVKDDRVLADAIASLLDDPPDRGLLTKRAELFSVAHSAEQYLDYLDEVVSRRVQDAV